MTTTDRPQENHASPDLGLPSGLLLRTTRLDAPRAGLRPPVTWRSILVGLTSVILLCSLAAYNDYAVNNTNLLGCHLPIGVLLFYLLFILLINAPLHRWWPRHALGSGELAVALGMTLCACALPTVGLMRYLPGHLTAFFNHAANSGEQYRRLMQELDLPDWMFPTFASSDPVARGNDPIVTGFVGRIPGLPDSFLARWSMIPWPAWLTPALTWGLFLMALFGAVLCLTLIFRRQWTDNERLPFPLATIYLSLIESPSPGKGLNSMLRSRGFWIAFGAVFCMHGINALHQYSQYWPEIPLSYNLGGVFSEPPWKYVKGDFKAASVYFTIIGIVLFMQSKVAFSVWFTYVATQVVRMIMGTQQAELTGGMQTDQMFGALVPFGIAILWVGRHHLAMVTRQMFRAPRQGEPRGRYLPYSIAGWGLILCLSGLVLWLLMAGASLIGAIVLVLMLMLVYLVLAKVVAETGLVYVLLWVPLSRPWVYALNDLPAALTARTTMRSYFFHSFLFGMFTHDLRESLIGYSTQAIRVADTAAYENESNWRKAVPFVLCMVLALAVAYVVSGASLLYVEYTNASTLDRQQLAPINDWGTTLMPRWIVLDDAYNYMPPRKGPSESHNRLAHFALGAGLVSAMSFLRLRYQAWPLHPVGFLLVYSWGIDRIWFSVLLGWIAKVLIVRFGGSQLLRASRGFFLGLIFGEAAAAGFWLVAALVRMSMGLDYRAIRLMPI